jgi:hypothetical protein
MKAVLLDGIGILQHIPCAKVAPVSEVFVHADFRERPFVF